MIRSPIHTPSTKLPNDVTSAPTHHASNLQQTKQQAIPPELITFHLFHLTGTFKFPNFSKKLTNRSRSCAVFNLRKINSIIRKSRDSRAEPTGKSVAALFSLASVCENFFVSGGMEVFVCLAVMVEKKNDCFCRMEQ